jgi:hypothetical protein
MKTAIAWITAMVLGTVWLIAAAHFDYERERVETEDANCHHAHQWAARQVCGENAAWQWLDDKTLQCYTHRGHRTGSPVVVAGGEK